MDRTNATTPQGEGTPQTQPTAPAAAGQQVGQGAAQPQYVTLEQAQQLAQQAADEAFRRAQSLYSKGQAGFEKRIQADLKNLERALELQRKAGIAVTPEQENQLRTQVINQAFATDDQPTEQVPGQQPAQVAEGEEAPDPITASAWKMMDDAKIDILEDDPEYQTVKHDDDDPWVFLQSIQAAIAAKRTRLATQPPTRTPTNAGAGGSQPPDTLAGKSLDEKWEAVKASGRI